VIDSLILTAGLMAFSGYIYFFLISVLVLMSFIWVNSENEAFFQSCVVVAALVYVVCNLVGFDLTAARGLSTVNMIGIAVVYLITGLIWSFTKWYLKLVDIRTKFEEVKLQTEEQLKLPEHIFELEQLNEAELQLNKKYWATIYSALGKDTWSALTYKQGVEGIKPKAAKYKEDIVKWIMFWPISAVWTLINDPFRKIGNFLFERFKNSYQRLSDFAFKDM
jgi:hypothetical protein